MNRCDPDNRPKWLICKNALFPDMLAIDPLKMPVFEITGSEFSNTEAHTADGISIRFPRITKQRSDKSPNEATSLEELKHLFEASKDGLNLQMLTDGLDDDDIDIKTTLQGGSTPKKRKQESATEAGNSKKTKSTSGDDALTIDKCDIESKNDHNLQLLTDGSHHNDIDIKTTSRDGSTPKKRKQESSTEAGTSKRAKATRNLDTLTIDNNDRRKDEEIFKEIVLYVCDDVRVLCTEELRYFKRWGGDETKNGKKCTHVLHKADSTIETLESARYTFFTN